MNHLDLNKTLGYDVGQRSGRDVCRKTLTSQRKTRVATIMLDATQFLNEAGLGGATVKAQLPLARLMGYLEQIASAIDLAESLGVSFTTNVSPYGIESLGARLDLQKLNRTAS